MMESRLAKVCGTVPRLRPVRWAACAFALMIGLVSSPSVARAESDNGFWSDYLIHASTCETALNDMVSEGTRCLLGNGLRLVLEESLRFADAYGKKRFGPRFQVAGNLSYSSVSSKFGIDGDIDMVLPFAGTGIVLRQARRFLVLLPAGRYPLVGRVRFRDCSATICGTVSCVVSGSRAHRTLISSEFPRSTC